MIVSNDSANAVLNRLQVVPLTSNAGRLYPAEAYVMLNGERCKAMTDQITTASKQRLRNRIGQLAANDVGAVEKAIRIQLALS